MIRLRSLRTLPLLIALAACADDPTGTPPPEPVVERPNVLGVYEFALTGIGTSEMRASAAPAPGGPGLTLTPKGSGLVFEQVSSGSFTDGPRGQGGHRYFSVTYRVRNSSGAAATNITLIPFITAINIPGTPYSLISRSDGSPADTAFARLVVPTGAVSLGAGTTMRAVDVDVLQVFTESEIAAVPLPSGVTQLMPYGFVVRSAHAENSRTLAPAANVADFGGLLTFAYRVPLASSSALDPYSVTIKAIAVEDSETRVTESMEDAQDSSAVRRLRERAAALGATSVTVLAGSPAAEFAVDAYPGQRHVCTVRTAGTAASPITFINNPAAYTRISVLRPGESHHACKAYFRTGTPAVAEPGMPYYVTLAALDRYGNVRPTAVDTVRLESVAGPGGEIGPQAAFVMGQATVAVTYGNYGTSVLRAVGLRNRGQQQVDVGAPYVAAYAGEWQAAMGGTPVPTRPAVIVRDFVGNPLPGRTVAFSVTRGEGTVAGNVVTTDANGVATVGNWFLGSAADLNTLAATASGPVVNNNPVTFAAAGCAGGGGTRYEITLCFTTAMSAAQRAAFANAAARWQGLVTNDIPNVPVVGEAGFCGATSPTTRLAVDDLLIFASTEFVDGTSGTLAGGGYCSIRTASKLPLVGRVRLDDADVAGLESSGQLERVILHEMGHVLGIGTLWPTFQLLQNPSRAAGPALDTYYSGNDGLTGFDEIGGTTYTGGEKVPVENTGPTGTINAHWRESVLGAELMTGILNSGDNPLSRLTVWSLGDLGYSVHPDGADPFFLTLAMRTRESPGGPELPLGDDVLVGPVREVDAQGRTTRRR